ncbi:MAG: L,D-transpeptidase family protein, partial [Gammaproteobacteria bacterium]|nr:L,D-transpeptidase family protein [Gammaproteobacteria bacterium]
SQYSSEEFPFHLRQQPGPANALGLVKFMLPNPYAIYLHDTPARQLFTRSARSFSHGCIRLEKPFVLAKYLLRNLPEWDEERRTLVAASGVETKVQLPKPIPVHLMYLTAWADSNGTVHFRDDVYERDVELARILGYQ